MRRALLLTAYDRPHYLRRVLDSWAGVRGLEGWHVRVAVEPSPVTEQVLALVAGLRRARPRVEVEVVANPVRLGVAENPYRHLAALVEAGHEFVVRAEDDLLVADDVLELFEHVSTAYAGRPQVATAHAFARSGAEDVSGGVEPDALQRVAEFCPWVWGTWADRWRAVIGPTWDHDYSTWNSSPGFESGWDWNLSTRVFPAGGLTAVAPLASRVTNLGVVGVDGTEDNHVPARGFRAHRPPGTFHEVGPGPGVAQPRHAGAGG